MSAFFTARGVGSIAASLVAASLAWSQPSAPTLLLVGADGVSKTLGLAELRALPQIAVVDSGRPTEIAHFRGPSVRALVSLVGAPSGHALRGQSMLLVVVAEARDGYKVAFSLAELDEQFGARTAIVAVSQNSAPLPANDGPLRIVLPAEQHHARWIRQLATLRLVRVGADGRAARSPNE